MTTDTVSYVVRSSDRSLFTHHFGGVRNSQGLRPKCFARNIWVRGGVQAIDHVLRILKRVRPQSSPHGGDNDSRKGIVKTLTGQPQSCGRLVRLAGSANHLAVIDQRGRDVQCVFRENRGRDPPSGVSFLRSKITGSNLFFRTLPTHAKYQEKIMELDLITALGWYESPT